MHNPESKFSPRYWRPWVITKERSYDCWRVLFCSQDSLLQEAKNPEDVWNKKFKSSPVTPTSPKFVKSAAVIKPLIP